MTDCCRYHALRGFWALPIHILHPPIIRCLQTVHSKHHLVRKLGRISVANPWRWDLTLKNSFAKLPVAMANLSTVISGERNWHNEAADIVPQTLEVVAQPGLLQLRVDRTRLVQGLAVSYLHPPLHPGAAYTVSSPASNTQSTHTRL